MLKWRTMFSTITTAPSTTIPKSSAPSDSRLAGICFRSRQVAANSREKGMVSATMIAPRMFPRNRNRTIDDQNHSFGQVVQNGVVVKWTRSLRSMKGTIFTPWGRM